MPATSIIILTHNSSKFINRCLSSIFAQDYRDFEIIVVDNGSKDRTPFFIKENYSEIRLIENKTNLGSAGARNQGIAIAEGDWMLTLDCDVVLEKGFFLNINHVLKQAPIDTGMIQPKILQSDHKTIYSAGILSSRLRRFYDIGKGKIDSGQFDQPKYLFGVCSAAAFYNRKMLDAIKEKTGYFDERFFFLFEDADLSWRAKRKGWKALFCPAALCYHSGDSSATPQELRQYLCWRNRYLMINKNESLLGKIKLYLFSFPYEFLRLIYLAVFNKYLWKKIPIN